MTADSSLLERRCEDLLSDFRPTFEFQSVPPLPEDDDRKPSAQPKFSQQDIGDGPESAQPLQQIESTEDARDAVFIELLDVAKEIRDLLKDAFEGTE